MVALLAATAGSASAAVPGHGRAWELVTPQLAHGAQLLVVRGWSADGDRVIYVTRGPLPGAQSGELFSHSVGRREAGGWGYEPVSVPLTVNESQLLGTLALGVSADLSTWAWSSVAPLLAGAPSAPHWGIYRRAPDGGLTLLGDMREALISTTFDAASADTEHLGFSTSEALLPADTGRVAGRAAYEFAGTSLRLIGVNDAGEPLSACGAVLGGASDPRTTESAISRSGSRAFVTSPDPATTQCGPSDVFLREDGLTTTDVSISRCTRADCGPAANVIFAGATADGSVAYLSTAEQLTNDDSDSGVDLYRYEVGGGDLSRVSTGPAGIDADVAQPIRVPDHGDRAYFVASGALVPGKGVAGAPNLYLREGGEVRFVGLLEGASLESAEISADGSALLFATSARLLPSDSDEQLDLYRYDALDGTLAQVSIGSNGAGNGPFDTVAPIVFEVFAGQHDNALTPDGERAFFSTPEGLVPEDVNGIADVYEWAEGRLELISSGTGEGNNTGFKGASADGRSVFFSTRQSLLPGDHDGGEADLYVARLGGGFAEPEPSPPCQGEACLAAPAAAGPQQPAPPTLFPAKAANGALGKRPSSPLPGSTRGPGASSSAPAAGSWPSRSRRRASSR